MARTIVTSSGSGIGKIYPNQPMMSISDTLFVYDINLDSLEYLKTLCQQKWNVINIYQLQVYADLKEFDEALRKLIRYGIFENQMLCNSLCVTTRDPKFTEIVNKAWQEEQRAITKFKGRKWPDSHFVKEFKTKQGSGAVSISREKMDMSDIVSWVFEMKPDEYTRMDEILPMEGEELPKPLEDDAYVIDGGTGLITEPMAKYYYHHEVTVIPIDETHTTPSNNLTMSFLTPQNTIIVDICRMHHVEIIKPATPEGGGGGE